MDATLAAVLVLAVALVLHTVILHRRLSALERGPAREEPADDLAARLDGLSDQIEERRLGARTEARLTEIGESLDRLSSTVAELQSHRPLPSGDGESPPVDVPGLVRHHLARRGFESVQLVTDTSELQGLSGEVAFEARMRGVMHKGRLTLRDGVVTDEVIRAAYAAFP